MNQSVQVGLVFPRSGQQLSVHISRQQADLLDVDGCEHTHRSERERSSVYAHFLPPKDNPARSQ